LRKRYVKAKYRDSITGIANRRFFDRELHRAWGNAQKTENPLSLLLCDIDHFQKYDAHYGHAAANTCLKQVGERLQATLRRPTDLAGRFEENKFAILLPYTDAHGALIITHRILNDVRGLAIPHECSDSAPTVTISIGGHSLWPILGLSFNTILHLAELRLFQAKHCGRNQSRLSTTCREVFEN
jgi:diguanylate cyclase (GGDEF)-like protein